MAAIIVIQDRCNSLAVLYSILYPIIRTDAFANQRYGKGHPMDNPVRIGKDLSVWRPYHSGSGRLQTPQEQIQG